jgi:DNA-binding transcriptional ArsR family regulator
MKDIFFIDRLDQIKALSDPLRVRILETLTQKEMTTKQVADLLGEPPTKLYRHVDTLHRVGLIEQIRTNTVNGIVEKYFRAVANSIRVDQDLFTSSPPGEAMESATEAIIHLLEATMAEFRQSLQWKIEGRKSHLISVHHKTFKIKESLADEFDLKLKKLMEEFEEIDSSEEAIRYRFTSAIFPLDEMDLTGD